MSSAQQDKPEMRNPEAGKIAAVTGAASVGAAFGRIGDHLGALICCAGMLRTGLMETMPVEAFDIVLNTNLRGRFLGAQKALPLLRRAATVENPSRAAVSQLCRVVAAEWASPGVLVNALAPGTVDTAMVRAVSDPGASKGYRPSGVSPVGRIAQPDDVIMFLLSDAARYVTGTTIPVDGGTQAAFIPSGLP
jgi:NAD(P)-dependent dehydrogenase (short-subunit alcohol dehydrogenase family)